MKTINLHFDRVNDSTIHAKIDVAPLTCWIYGMAFTTASAKESALTLLKAIEEAQR